MSNQAAKKIFLLVLAATLTLCLSTPLFADNADNTPETAPLRDESQEIIAKVGDNVLTKERVDWMQQNASPDIVKQIADWWIEMELLYREAVKSEGMFRDDQDKYMFELEYKRMYVRKFVDYLQTKDFNISEEEAKEYYENNKTTDTRLQNVGQATFHHIECSTLEKAQEIIEKLKAGENIKELAKKESIAKDANQGGYVIKMGFGVIRRRFGPEVAEKIEKAELNTPIGPVKNRNDNYEVISVEYLRETRVLAFEQVRDKINATLLGEKRNQYFEDYRNNLKKVHADEIYRSPILDVPTEDEEPAEPQE